MSKPLIGVTESEAQYMAPFLHVIEKAGGEPWPIFPDHDLTANETVARMDGFLAGGGPDIHPSQYGHKVDESANVKSQPERDAMEIPLLKAAVDADLPVLGVCRGMQALNIVFGGTLIQDLGDRYPGHGHSLNDKGEEGTSRHRIFISPGSRLAMSVGSGGLVRVNTWHHQGVAEANRSPKLMASAYSLEDGLIEGLESPHHKWVVGVQFHPELRGEMPPHFDRLFDGLVGRAKDWK
jgi:putative glutamine amidotransferase